jgi:hypothetical protein
VCRYTPSGQHRGTVGVGIPGDRGKLSGGAYLARFHTSSALPPVDAVGLLYFISSPWIAMRRFWLAPFQFGNELSQHES